MMGIFYAFTVFCFPLTLATTHCVGSEASREQPFVVGEFLRVACGLSVPAVALVLLTSPGRRCR